MCAVYSKSHYTQPASSSPDRIKSCCRICLKYPIYVYSGLFVLVRAYNLSESYTVVSCVEGVRFFSGTSVKAPSNKVVAFSWRPTWKFVKRVLSLCRRTVDGLSRPRNTQLKRQRRESMGEEINIDVRQDKTGQERNRKTSAWMWLRAIWTVMLARASTLWEIVFSDVQSLRGSIS